MAEPRCGCPGSSRVGVTGTTLVLAAVEMPSVPVGHVKEMILHGCNNLLNGLRPRASLASHGTPDRRACSAWSSAHFAPPRGGNGGMGFVSMPGASDCERPRSAPLAAGGSVSFCAFLAAMICVSSCKTCAESPQHLKAACVHTAPCVRAHDCMRACTRLHACSRTVPIAWA